MGQDDVQKHPDPAREDVTAADSTVSSGAPISEAPPEATPAAPAREVDPDDTVGTGTSIALGCIAGTLLLIVIGLIFVALLAVF